MMKNIFFGLFTLWLSIAYTQIPSYYSTIDFTQNSTDLRVDINTLLSNTLTNYVVYTSSTTTDVWDVLKTSDLDPTDTAMQNVLLIYGYNDTDAITMNDRTRSKVLSCHVSSCIGLWNREHVYPSSIGTFDTDFPGIGTDVHNIRSCDGQMNSSRSNRLFQDATGNSHITSSGYWYPGDEWKGDVARIIMYMEVLYPANTWANQIGVSTNTYHPDMLDVFLLWNVQDPVSDLEIQRNNEIASIQGNRNPFIDNPYIATLLWGGPVAQDTWGVLSTNDFIFSNLKIYPTITGTFLNVNTTLGNSYTYKIYSVSGQLVLEPKATNTIDVSNLQNGMYFLKIISENNSVNKIFIKK